MPKPVGFYKEHGKTKPITKKKDKSSYNGQTQDPNWKESSIQDLKTTNEKMKCEATACRDNIDGRCKVYYSYKIKGKQVTGMTCPDFKPKEKRRKKGYAHNRPLIF